MTAVTYDWYEKTFPHGVITDDDAFDSVLTEATEYVVSITRGRANPEDEQVKKAICAVAEVIYKQCQDESAVVSSESVGNHSKSYTKQAKSVADREAEKARKASLYLSCTGLLYRGLR